jgi:hypothetical protein
VRTHAMTTPKFVRTLAPLLLVLAAASAARAGTVKGTVHLPESARTGRVYQGYWRLENGNVPVRAGGTKPGTVVVLDGLSGVHAPPPKTVSVSIAALGAQPRVVVVGPGSVVEFKNDGKFTHELSTPADPSLMPGERLNPGTFRRQRFGVPGGYLVRCSEYPSLAISVIVVDSPYYAVVDDKGAFSIPGVPDTKANLKVWSGGRWVHDEPIDAAAKQDLAIRVESGKATKEPEVKESDSEGKESDPSNPETKEPDPKGSAQ